MKRSQSLLSASETELRDLKNSTGLASPADQRKLLVDRIARLEDKLLEAEATRVATQTEWQMSQAVLSGGPLSHVTAENAGVADDSMDSMQRQLYLLQLKEQELLAKFTEDQPEIKQVRRQIAASQVVLDREEKNRRSTKWPRNTYEQTQLALLQQETQLASLKSKSDVIEKQLQAARGELKTLNGHEVQIQRLQRQVEIHDNTYRKYADNLEQANIDQALAAVARFVVTAFMRFDCSPARRNPTFVLPRISRIIADTKKTPTLSAVHPQSHWPRASKTAGAFLCESRLTKTPIPSIPSPFPYAPIR